MALKHGPVNTGPLGHQIRNDDLAIVLFGQFLKPTGHVHRVANRGQIQIPLDFYKKCDKYWKKETTLSTKKGIIDLCRKGT